MTLRELVGALDQRPLALLVAFLTPPVAVWLVGRLHGRGHGHEKPWKYIYAVLVYAACVPGIFASVLTGYALLFANENLLDVNALVYLLPPVSMVATLMLISRRVRFDDVPGFDRLSGLMAMIAVAFALALALHKSRLWIVFGGSIFMLFAVAAFLLALFQWGARMLFHHADEPRPEPPTFTPPLLLLCGLCATVAASGAQSFLPSGKPYELVHDATPWQTLRVDFEQDVDGRIMRLGAQPTAAPALVISGSRSLLVDARDARGEWNEFIHTATGVRWEPGRIYRLRLRYRYPAEPQAPLYALLRSARRGANDATDQHLGRWLGLGGGVEVQDVLIEPRDIDDAYLIIGLHGRDRVVIDDVELARIDGDPPGADLPLAPRHAFPRAVPDYLDELRAREGMADVVDPVLVILCNEGAGIRVISASDALVARLQPDWVDWNPCGDLGALYGIRTARSRAEYQELYMVESGDAWERRVELFADDGFVREIGGNTYASSVWAAGGYYTCHNAPTWHAWQGGELLKALDEGEGLCQDNIAVGTHNSLRGCFCKQCARLFRDWLGQRYSRDELRARGVADLASFNIREYWVAHGLLGERGLRDAVAREFVLFQHRSQREAWADLVMRAKTQGRLRGELVPIGGNQIFVNGFWVYSPTLSPYNDFIEVEELVSVRHEIENTSWMYRMGAASGRYERPVWVRGPVTREGTNGEDPREGVLDPFYWTVHLGEALAMGGVRVLSLGINRPWAGDPDARHYVEDEQLMELFTQYSRSVRGLRAAFARTRSLAKVGVVYSMPSAVWRDFRALGDQPKRHFEACVALSRELDRKHIPHDAVILGHPDLWDDEPLEETLARYEALLLPEVDCLSARQRAALASAREQGAQIFARSEETAAPRNEHYELIDAATLGEPLDAHWDELARYRLETDAPAEVLVAPRAAMDGRALVAHLVDYGQEVYSATAPAPRPAVRLTLPLPDTVPPTAVVRWHALGEPPRGRVVAAQLNHQLRVVTVEVEGLYGYGAVVVADADELAAASRALDALRDADAERVKTMWRARVERASAVYER